MAPEVQNYSNYCNNIQIQKKLKKTEEFAKRGSQTVGRKRIFLSKGKATYKAQKNGNTAQVIQI
jgi:hypothetical protein